jgi:two-component system, OmpR family, sensor kinase
MTPMTPPTSRRAGRVLVPLLASSLGLGGALTTTLYLHHAAVGAIDGLLEERLRGAGESAAALLSGMPLDSERLRSVMAANGLDGAYVVTANLRVAADATGLAGRRADVLRLDLDRVEAALAGRGAVSSGYSFGALRVLTGYFPLWQGQHLVGGVLVLEAGQSLAGARLGIGRARTVGVVVSFISACGLALAAMGWNRAERLRRDAAARAARGEILSRVAAMAAHEIRNPIGVIGGTVELMLERSAAKLGERDRQALDDIAGEVDRLARLTDDLLDLANRRPLTLARVALPELLRETARACEAAYPGITVVCDIDEVPRLPADAARLRQVFANLLANAAQARPEGRVQVRVTLERGHVRAVVEDEGPGISEAVAERIFELHFTTRSDGTGLGLAIARSYVERHGGTLRHLPERLGGAAFEVRLPVDGARGSSVMNEREDDRWPAC